MRFSKFFLFLAITCAFAACTEPSAEALEDEIELEDSESNSDETEQPTPEKESSWDKPLSNWKSYHNQRFEFCLDYPSSFLTEMGESENHDGNTFANANGSSEMRASGIYNALDETVAEAFERATEKDTYYEDEKVITYKQQKDNWFVASGTYYESIFYVKTVLVEDTFYTLYFEYHSSEKEKFDEIIKRTTKNFPKC